MPRILRWSPASSRLAVGLLATWLVGWASGQDTGDAALAQARHLWAAKEYARAADAYRALRDRFPDHALVRSGDAQFWLWCSLGNAGKREEEIEEIQRFLEDFPQHRSRGYALYFLGDTLWKLGREDEAKAAWRELREKHPDDPMIRFLDGGNPSTRAPASTKGVDPTDRFLGGPDYVDVARGAARWLAATAREEGGGLAWPKLEGEEGSGRNVYDGAAGICLYFLNLEAVLAEEEFGEIAAKGAAALASQAKKTKDGLVWEEEDRAPDGSVRRNSSPGLYTGTAGIGSVFLGLHRADPKGRWLGLARGAADGILADAGFLGNGDGWGPATDIISGPAGIALFLLDLHEATRQKKYLVGAESAAEWLVAQAVKDGEGLKWRSSAGLERFYTGFSHGTAGIAYTLARVYEATGKKTYLEAAEAGAAWLLEKAIAEGEGCKWFHYELGGEDRFQTGWCHGPAGTGRLFLLLHRLTGNASYLEAAEGGARWLMATLSVGEGDTAFWGLSMCCGAAGIGDYFLDLFLATGNDAYLEFAARVADELIRRARAADGAYSWTNYDRPDDEGKIYYGTGHMTGAAGVGSFFLRLHAVLQNRESRFIPFADKPRIPPSQGGPKEGGYAVMTNLEPGDPYFEAAKLLLEAHDGVLVPCRPGEAASARRRLTRLRPRNVAVVLRPEAIDVNTQREVLALSTRMDVDPFCDFAFGFVTGAEPSDAVSLVRRGLEASRRGVSKTRVSASVASGVKSYEIAEPASDAGFRAKHLYWACVEDDPGVLAFVKAHIAELGGKGIVELFGCGDPEGIWLFSDRRNMDASKHWPFDPAKVGLDPKGEMPRITADLFRRLAFDGAVVWSGTCHSGVLHRAFVEGDIVSTFGIVDRVTEYVIPQGRSLGLAILGAGPSAYLAPIGPNHGYACDVERARAMATGLPLGEVMRTRYNEIVLAAGGAPDLRRYVPGAPRIDEDAMRGGGANRTLFGDPLVRPFAGSGEAALKQESARLPGAGGVRVTCTVADAASSMFWDMFGADREHPERIYTTAPLPEGMRAVGEVTARAVGPEGTSLEITPPRWLVESIDGTRAIHLQVNAARGTLAHEGTRVEFTVRATRAR